MSSNRSTRTHHQNPTNATNGTVPKFTGCIDGFITKLAEVDPNQRCPLGNRYQIGTRFQIQYRFTIPTNRVSPEFKDNLINLGVDFLHHKIVRTKFFFPHN